MTVTTHFRFELTRKSVDNQLVSLVSADRIKVVKGSDFSTVTILALIVFGYFKSKLTGQPLLKGTIKVASIGIIAAAAAAFLLAKAVS